MDLIYADVKSGSCGFRKATAEFSLAKSSLACEQINLKVLNLRMEFGAVVEQSTTGKPRLKHLTFPVKDCSLLLQFQNTRWPSLCIRQMSFNIISFSFVE